MAIGILAQLVLGAGILGGARALGGAKRNQTFANALLSANTFTDIGPGQLQNIATLAVQDPSLAMQLLQQQQKQQLDARKLQQEGQFAQQRIDLTERQVEVSERTGARADATAAIAQQRLAAGIPANLAPGTRAALDEQGQFERAVPIAGSPQFIKQETNLRNTAGAQQRLNRYREIVSQFIAQPGPSGGAAGSVAGPGGQALGLTPGELPISQRNELVAELQALNGLIALDLKNATGAGALDQGLIDLVEQIIADPTGLTVNLGQTASSILARVDPLVELTENNLRQAFADVRGFEGLDPEVTTFANDAFQQSGALTGRLGTQLGEVRAIREARRDPNAPLSVRTLESLSNLQAIGLDAIQNNPVSNLLGRVF